MTLGRVFFFFADVAVYAGDAELCGFNGSGVGCEGLVDGVWAG